MQDDIRSENALNTELPEVKEAEENKTLKSDVIETEVELVKEDVEKSPDDDLPTPIKERLGRQQHKHNKELRALKQQLATLQYQLQNNQPPHKSNEIPANGPVTDIQNGVKQALRDMMLEGKQQEEVRKQADRIAQVQAHYDSFQESLESASSIYEDFDDVVLDDSAPFTSIIRDAAILIPNPIDVLYRLGKNRAELKRIANLPPLELSREIIKLSATLMAQKSSTSKAPKPLEPLKHNPATNYSSAITEKTSVSEIRKLLKTPRR